jgi:hypothetical protein
VLGAFGTLAVQANWSGRAGQAGRCGGEWPAHSSRWPSDATPIITMQVSNDSGGSARLLATVAEVVPGRRVMVCIEGTRSYGIGLARALAAAGLLVIECEQPRRKQRRGKGKSDPIDAHLAVLAALRLDTARVPVPRADGDREALRILLVARPELAVTGNARAAGCVPCWPVTTPIAGLPARP